MSSGRSHRDLPRSLPPGHLMVLTDDQLRFLQQCRERLQAGFCNLPVVHPSPLPARIEEVLLQTAERLQDNYPYHHPFYLGQMLRPPHPVALLAYSLAMTINPNNHAHDGGRATSALERECVQQIAEMFGFSSHLGHLCGGGTIANFEALWVARELTNCQPVAASAHAHYTHERLSRVLQVPFFPVPVDSSGRMDLNHLESLLRAGVGTVVATLGTTGLGAVDPLKEIVELKKKYRFRLHVDAAYGGYFKLDQTLSQYAAEQFAAIPMVDSIVVDPHKHGLQPYGCGCVLFRDRSVAAIYKHESPYTYFTSDDLHLGEISLECSRAGASAAALWATLQLFPLTTDGEFAVDLGRCRAATRELSEWVTCQPRYLPVVSPELDLFAWMIRGKSATESTQLARRFFDAAAEQDVHLALFNVSRGMLESRLEEFEWDAESVTCLRVCTMKAEHKEWMPQILERLQTVTALLL